MSIWHLLFGFDGRINRKPYIITITVLMLVAAALMLGGATLVTGDRSPWSSGDCATVWGPIYGGVWLLAIWPTLALATKRLHDRNYPLWIGLAFYLVLLIASAAIVWFGPGSFEAASAHRFRKPPL